MYYCFLLLIVHVITILRFAHLNSHTLVELIHHISLFCYTYFKTKNNQLIFFDELLILRFCRIIYD